MGRYLSHRTPAESMPIPAELRSLRSRRHPVAVTLRRRGAVVALAVRDEADPCTNLLAAALRALRSPKLPDRVDRQVLAALTVEVDVLSSLRDVRRGELAEQFVPGLTGLAYSRGGPEAPPGRTDRSVAWVLPAAAYVLGLDAEQVRRGAMGRFRLTAANASRPSRLAIFTTRHYVGQPGGRVVELFRGKDLSRRGALDGQALLAAAERVGAYLAGHQAPTGRYLEDDRPASLRDHLYAAWAMARLARGRGAGQLADSASHAAAHAMKLLRRQQRRAWVATRRAEDRLAATALLALTLQQSKLDGRISALRQELARYLAGELSGLKAPAASRPAAASAGAYVAMLALSAEPDAARDDLGIRKTLAGAEPADLEARLWAWRAGLRGPPVRGHLSQRGPEALPDESGGFAAPGAAPSTLLTGLAAACLSRPPAHGGVSSEAEVARRRLAAARPFCYGMMYQPAEAYFAGDPRVWVGGVRAGPQRAAVTTAACAAAIDAFLAR